MRYSARGRYDGDVPVLPVARWVSWRAHRAVFDELRAHHEKIEIEVEVAVEVEDDEEAPPTDAA